MFDYYSITESSAVLDIGSNIGQYSYYLSKFVLENKGSCIGFEPRMDIWKRLINNVEYMNFTGERVALSNKIGFVDLCLPTDHQLSSLFEFEEFEGFRTEKVPVTTLDSFISLKNISSIPFIKIDVEGHELEVLAGGYQTFQKYKPVILCESENRHLAPQGKSVEDVLNFMININYQSYVFNYNNYEFLPVKDIIIPSGYKGEHNYYYYNYWFIHQDDEDIVYLIRKIGKNLQ